MNILTPDFLRAVRRDALRRRTWHKVLDRMERGIVNLTIRYVERIRSFTLARSIVGILKKLRDARKSVFVRRHEEFGLARAVEVVSLAVSLGSDCAMGWLSDNRLSMWLTLNSMYSPYGVNPR